MGAAGKGCPGSTGPWQGRWGHPAPCHSHDVDRALLRRPVGRRVRQCALPGALPACGFALFETRRAVDARTSPQWRRASQPNAKLARSSPLSDSTDRRSRIPLASAILASTEREGSPRVSIFDTLDWVTPSRSATSIWVNPSVLRNSRIRAIRGPSSARSSSMWAKAAGESLGCHLARSEFLFLISNRTAFRFRANDRTGRTRRAGVPPATESSTRPSA